MGTPRLKIAVGFWLIVGAGWFMWHRQDSTPLEAIAVADGAVTVRNETQQDWQGVRIWVNDHYAGGARTIPAGGFVREPLSRFVAAQGQTMNAATRVSSVVVLGRTPDGTAVRIAWGKPFLH